MQERDVFIIHLPNSFDISFKNLEILSIAEENQEILHLSSSNISAYFNLKASWLHYKIIDS